MYLLQEETRWVRIPPVCKRSALFCRPLADRSALLQTADAVEINLIVLLRNRPTRMSGSGSLSLNYSCSLNGQVLTLTPPTLAPCNKAPAKTPQDVTSLPKICTKNIQNVQKKLNPRIQESRDVPTAYQDGRYHVKEPRMRYPTHPDEGATEAHTKVDCDPRWKGETHKPKSDAVSGTRRERRGSPL